MIRNQKETIKRGETLLGYLRHILVQKRFAMKLSEISRSLQL